MDSAPADAASVRARALPVTQTPPAIGGQSASAVEMSEAAEATQVMSDAAEAIQVTACWTLLPPFWPGDEPFVTGLMSRNDNEKARVGHRRRNSAVGQLAQGIRRDRTELHGTRICP